MGVFQYKDTKHLLITILQVLSILSHEFVSLIIFCGQSDSLLVEIRTNVLIEVLKQSFVTFTSLSTWLNTYHIFFHNKKYLSINIEHESMVFKSRPDKRNSWHLQIPYSFRHFKLFPGSISACKYRCKQLLRGIPYAQKNSRGLGKISTWHSKSFRIAKNGSVSLLSIDFERDLDVETFSHGNAC